MLSFSVTFTMPRSCAIWDADTAYGRGIAKGNFVPIQPHSHFLFWHEAIVSFWKNGKKVNYCKLIVCFVQNSLGCRDTVVPGDKASVLSIHPYVYFSSQPSFRKGNTLPMNQSSIQVAKHKKNPSIHIVQIQNILPRTWSWQPLLRLRFRPKYHPIEGPYFSGQK